MLNDRIEVRMKKATKEKLKRVAIKEQRRPSEMARILIEKSLAKKTRK